MRGLLAGKEALKAFYARYSAFVNAFLRFITAFAAVFLINQNIGLMPKLSGGLVPLFAGIICAFLPFGAIAFLIGIFLLAQLFAASMEVALITLVFLLIVVLLYYGFQPGEQRVPDCNADLVFSEGAVCSPDDSWTDWKPRIGDSDELRDFSVLRDSVCEAERKLPGRQ
ncbi:MAG: hypothetical protein ACLR8P_15610 [Clostridium fessum]